MLIGYSPQIFLIRGLFNQIEPSPTFVPPLPLSWTYCSLELPHRKLTTFDNRLSSVFARFIAPLEVSISERLQLLLMHISREVLQPSTSQPVINSFSLLRSHR